MRDDGIQTSGLPCPLSISGRALRLQVFTAVPRLVRRQCFMPTSDVVGREDLLSRWLCRGRSRPDPDGTEGPRTCVRCVLHALAQPRPGTLCLRCADEPARCIRLLSIGTKSSTEVILPRSNNQRSLPVNCAT